jgi:hypothetical protein
MGAELDSVQMEQLNKKLTNALNYSNIKKYQNLYRKVALLRWTRYPHKGSHSQQQSRPRSRLLGR